MIDWELLELKLAPFEMKEIERNPPQGRWNGFRLAVKAGKMVH